MPRVNVVYRGCLGLAISLFPILIHPIFAQNVSGVCYDGDFATVNATASVEINGMHPQDSLNGSAAGHYIVSTAVKEVINVTQNTSVIRQTFWLKADPIITTSPSHLPFAGCAFLLQAAPGSSLIGGNVSDTQCQDVLPNGCTQTILDIIQSNVTALSQAALDDDIHTCPTLSEILRIPPSECKGAEWHNVIAVQAFGNPSFVPLFEPECETSGVNVFNGSATTNALVELSSEPLPLGNQTYYNQTIRTTTPVFLTSWPRNVSFSWIADVRMACLTPETNIQDGSLVPTSGAAIRHYGGNVRGVVLALGLLALGFL